MDQPGVETRPIKLISGATPFCETYFNDARAEKSDLDGPLNKGWSVVKRLLQHERASQTSARGPEAGGKSESLYAIAKRYAGETTDGKLEDADLRARLTRHLMDAEAHRLTAERIAAEAKGNVEVSAAASIMKNSATSVSQTRSGLMIELMGYRGLAWEGETFRPQELDTVGSGSGARRSPFTADPPKCRTTSFPRIFSACPRPRKRVNAGMAALTEEQTLPRDQAEAWVRDEFPVTKFRAMRDSKADGAIMGDAWQGMVEMGWTGILVPEAWGLRPWLSYLRPRPRGPWEKPDGLAAPGFRPRGRQRPAPRWQRSPAGRRAPRRGRRLHHPFPRGGRRGAA